MLRIDEPLVCDPRACPRCGQHEASSDTGMARDRVCVVCRAQDRAPQGETVRLFEPAPNVMPGQLSF